MALDPKAPEEVALIVPRLHADIALPQPLPASDAALVRRIFALQEVGNMVEADRLTSLLTDTTLLSPILADRCLRQGTACPEAVQATLQRDDADQPAPAANSPPANALPGAELPAEAPFRASHASAAEGRVRRLWERHADAAAIAMATRLSNDAEASFLGGLAAWRLGDVAQATALFETAASRPNGGSNTLAAAAFWAARAHRQQGDLDGAMTWLRAGARHTGSFYGIMSRRLLSAGGELPGRDARLGIADLDLVASLPAGRRMLALVQVGQPDLAGAELRQLWEAVQGPEQRRAVQLTALAAGLGSQLAALPDRTIVLPARFTASSHYLAPAGGFIVDPALVYGLVQVESNFATDIVSHAGARGLMQLMPATAADFAGHGSARSLNDGSNNLMIGQRYVAFLAADRRVNFDLLRMLVSYNAGPANCARWDQDLRAQTDPLLYIEAISRTETRQFVQKVLTQSWLFAARMSLPTPTLDALAGGNFPILAH